jgi:hypothetical protein
MPSLFITILTMQFFEPIFLVLDELINCLDHLRLSDLVFHISVIRTLTNLTIVIFLVHESFEVSVEVFLSFKDSFEVLSSWCYRYESCHLLPILAKRTLFIVFFVFKDMHISIVIFV